MRDFPENIRALNARTVRSLLPALLLLKEEGDMHELDSALFARNLRRS